MFATNPRRRSLFVGLVDAASRLRQAGCKTLYLDGSFVSGKPQPGDFDICWDPAGVDVKKLDPVFLDFSNGRAAQKHAFGGEFFPSSWPADLAGRAFIDFFQQDRFTGTQKGVIAVSL